MKIKICKYCIQPDTRPNVYFNEEGICGACLWEKEKETIDWDNREKELQEIADNAKQNTTSNMQPLFHHMQRVETIYLCLLFVV